MESLFLFFSLGLPGGNIFNLLGCLLGLATLPTQYHTALEHRLMESSKAYGQCLGWMMAAIYMAVDSYMIKRGSVEGLNPLIFIFALVANATYVGSILVRSTAWEKIKANLPWLLDVIVFVALDLFIILQYIYYRYTSSRVGYEDYIEASEALVS